MEILVQDKIENNKLIYQIYQKIKKHMLVNENKERIERIFLPK
jgi:hypothetical protein